jgi:hypothetical protein
MELKYRRSNAVSTGTDSVLHNTAGSGRSACKLKSTYVVACEWQSDESQISHCCNGKAATAVALTLAGTAGRRSTASSDQVRIDDGLDGTEPGQWALNAFSSDLMQCSLLESNELIRLGNLLGVGNELNPN